MTRSACSRADLVRVLAARDTLVPFAADIIGYTRIVRQTSDEPADKSDPSPIAAESSITSEIKPALVAGSDWPGDQAAIRSGGP